MRASTLFLVALFLLVSTVRPPATAAQTPDVSLPPSQSEDEKRAMLERVVANQKKNDEAESIYERIERKEIRKTPPEVKISRTVPAGTGIDHIPVGPDGKPTDVNLYRAELEKLEHSLAWAAEDGRAQREAYDKIAKKQKDRSEMIDATRSAFLYTFVGREPHALQVPNGAESRV